jgi:HlyD family secretion protein
MRLIETSCKLTAFAIASLALLFAAPSCKKSDDEIEPEDHTVAVGQIREAVVCDGKIEAATSVEIKSKASGILEFKGFEVGDVVPVGTLMYRLDKSLIQQNVVQAQAQVKSARAQLTLAKRDQSRDERVQLENAVEQAKIDLRDAEDYLSRINDLHEREYATDQELQDAKATVERARLKLELAEKRLAESNAGGEKEDIEVAQSRVTLAEADLKNALEELAETEIVAPLTGVLLTQDVEVGDTITSATRGAASGSVLGTLADLSHVYLKGYVDETDVGRVSVGMPAEVGINSYPGRVFEGRLAKIYPMAESQQGVTSFMVDIELTGGGFVTRQNMKAGTDGGGGGDAESKVAGEKPDDGNAESTGDGGGGGNESDSAKQKDAKADDSNAKDGGGDAADGGKSASKEGSPSGDGGGGANGGDGKRGEGKGRGGSRKPSGPVEVRVGMTADAQIIIRDVPEALIIPVTFINFRDTPPTVNLKDTKTGEYAPVEIKVGFTDGVNIVIEDGLNEGDVIVRVPRKEKPPLRR